MAKRDILKEAIADAKAVKEVAISNAKAALEEAFTPRIKSMFAAKIQEMELDEDEESKIDNRKDGGESKETKRTEKMKYGKDLAESDIEEDIDLDEILAELETETLNEVEEEEVETEEEVEVEDYDTEEEVDMDDDETESVDIEDMTDEDLKNFIEDVIGDMVASGDLEAGEGFEGGEEVEMDDDEEIDIEIEDDETEEVEIAERRSKSNHNLMERLNQEKRAKIKAITENKKLRRELKGAYAAIKTQKSTLNEVRLLNAKLLYTNKIFKAKSLNENEKVKVLSSFDKATTIKETQLIFETLSEGLNSKRKPIRESLGSASKTTGNFTKNKKPIIETDPMVARFQKLAGLK
tara:strand:+ start:1576 stop:2628 length:1053 start_codon:yes stop_codon:yes gene_type:complete